MMDHGATTVPEDPGLVFPEHSRCRLVRPKDPPIQTEKPHGIVDRIERAVPFFNGLLKQCFRLFALRDIAKAPHAPDRLFPEPLGVRLAFKDPSVL